MTKIRQLEVEALRKWRLDRDLDERKLFIASAYAFDAAETAANALTVAEELDRSHEGFNGNWSENTERAWMKWYDAVQVARKAADAAEKAWVKTHENF
ncbi:MAG: hypothetical protein WCM93_14415 [Bacteroidota bacterium]